MFFSTPFDYQEWLINQKFVANQEQFDTLKEGDEIELNYRYMKPYDNKFRFDVIKGTFVKQIDKTKSIVILRKNTDDENYNKEIWLKSTIASIEIIK
jgi:ribosomal protein L19